MTAAMGRFPLVDPRFIAAVDDGSRAAGVPYAQGVLTRTLSPDFVTSIRSSSSSLATPFDFDSGSCLVCNSHLPSGCMVT